MNRASPARGRGWVLAGGCLAVFWPGALVFGYPGVMAAHWAATLSASAADIGAMLFFVLAAVGGFMYPAGRLQRRVGSHPLALAGVGLAGASCVVAIFINSLALLYIYAFLSGLASALVYLSSVSAAQAWFPERRGLVSGMVNMFFGGSGALTPPLMAWLFKNQGYAAMNLWLALFCLVMGLFGAWLVRLPKSRAAPGQMQPEPSLPPSRALRTRGFWMIWLTLALMGSSGIAMIILAPSYARQLGHPLMVGVMVLAAFNLGSGISRLASGFVSDKVGRRPVMSLAFAAAGLAYLALPWLKAVWAVAPLAFVVGWAFGTLFAVAGPLTLERFGPLYFGEIFGLAFTAYGLVSGLFGPTLAGYLLDVTGGNYVLVFSYLGASCLAAAGAVCLVRKVKPQPVTK